MTEPQSTRTVSPASRRRMSLRRHHAGEGLEDPYNVPGILLCGLAVIALALFLTAAGYGIWGWAIVAAIVVVAAGVAGVVWLLAERRRMNRLLPPAPERQGH